MSLRAQRRLPAVICTVFCVLLCCGVSIAQDVMGRGAPAPGAGIRTRQGTQPALTPAPPAFAGAGLTTPIPPQLYRPVLDPSRAPDASQPIVPNDILTVRIGGEAELTGEYTVWPDGTIDMPWIGAIEAAGLLPNQVAAKVADAYTPDILLEARVSVAVARYASRPIWVYGAVNSPGPIEWQDARTLMQAIYMAGGPQANADLTAIVLRRSEEVVAVVDLEGFFRRADPSNDVDIRPHDQILLAERGVIYLVGRVAAPGMVPLLRGPNLREAIIAAGGALEAAGLSRTIIIRDEEVIQVDLAALLEGRDLGGNVTLEDGDVIIVPPNKVTVIGDVMMPGPYEVPTDTTLREMMALAGGAMGTAALGRVTIIRDEQEMLIDARGLLGEQPGVAENPTLMPDDLVIVPRGLVYVAGEVMTTDLDNVVVLRDGRENIISVNGLLAPGGQDLDMSIQAEDHVIFPRLEEELIYLVGGWQRPGPVPYEEASTLLMALAHIGEDVDANNVDWTRVALVRDGQTTTLDIEDLVFEGNIEKDIDLLPDDIVIAPQNRDNYVYLVGEVANPGPLPYEARMTLGEALMKAGGTLASADIESIRVTRVRVDEPYKFHVNHRKWVAHGDRANNPELMAGDIIRVPVRTSVRIREFLGNIGLMLQPLTSVERALELFN